MDTHEQQHGFFSNFRNLFSKKNNEVLIAEDELEMPIIQRTDNDAPTNRPMATRTVDFSHTEFVPVTAPKFLEETPEKAATEIVTLDPPADLDIQFATGLIEKGGKFMYCESMAAAIEELKRQAEDNGWAHVFCWENEIKDAFHENNFQRGVIGYTIENSDAAMCLCEGLVAASGAILLNPKQASRRRLPVFPKTQIFLADVSQLRADLNKAIMQFAAANRGELPSVLDLCDNVKGHYYHDGSLVLKAEGPEDIYVFLIDEKIPVSTKA
ncbi:MAG: LUD domain-containing protein [Chitinophagales bacterium]